jgi:glycosyltransferase involved in cell wall biosynthesis
MLTPEAPYPLAGGGPMRTASILEFLASTHDVDVIAFREQEQPDPAGAIPSHLVRRIVTLELPFHSRSVLARAVRNARRYLKHASPLVDRFTGFESHIEEALRGRRYDLAVVEHFWCAPYCELLRKYCDRVVMDLHNIESVLLARCGKVEKFPRSAVFRRFARATRRLEHRLLPCFSALLVSSDHDAVEIRKVAPYTKVIVYPNAVPLSPPLETQQHDDAIVFSGNLEYEPNRSAVTHFQQCIWPLLKQRWPALRWRVIGKNHHRVKSQLSGDPRVDVIGPVADAITALASAKVAVVPLLAGSGTRIKIIEAWAAGVPVVSTSIGAEGLPGLSGEHFLIADEPAAFCEAVSTLLNSNDLRLRLAANGRHLYETDLSWPAVWQRLQTTGL